MNLIKRIQNRPLYHYTSAQVINSIASNGLLISSKKTSEDGNKLGIYLTTDPNMNFFETIQDSTFKKDVEIYRIEISTSQNIHAILDPEFHSHVKNEEDLIADLEIFENHLMLYIPINILPQYIEDIIKMEKHMQRSYDLFGEM